MGQSHRTIETTHASTIREAHFRIGAWLDSHKWPPTWRAVAREFGVTRSTAFRILADWRAARGMQ